MYKICPQRTNFLPVQFPLIVPPGKKCFKRLAKEGSFWRKNGKIANHSMEFYPKSNRKMLKNEKKPFFPPCIAKIILIRYT